MQLALDSLDRLVELAEESGGRVRATVAARRLFAVARAPEGLARTLLGPLVEADARLAWRGPFVALADEPNPPVAKARFVVFDLETTGLSATSARVCEIGAVRIERLEQAGTFETLVAPGVPLPRPVERLTGLSDGALRAAPPIGEALRRFCAFAGGAALVAHNARFDVSFVDRALERTAGRRLAAPVIDTVALARALLRGRVERTDLRTLACFFGVSVEPCHRALPDAQATAEVFLRLVELALERGAATLAELEELAAPRPRRIHAKRRLVRDAPPKPGVYLFRDGAGRVLYVGKARDLRARLRSYFHTPRQRRPLEAALDELEEIEWRVTGSELAAALEEVRLIRRLRPPANARVPEPERYVFLHRRGGRVVASRAPSRYGPLRAGAEVKRAAQALAGCSEEEFERLLEGEALDRLRRRLGELSLCGHDLELRRLRRSVASLERVLERLRRLEELRSLEVCILAPALAPGLHDAFVVAGGGLSVHERVAAAPRPTPHGGAAGALDADRLDELLVLASYLERPPPELTVVRR
ncbi:MAG TPA: exonuclease domain-containing protein [Gaiellaceae bacterium]|nr:exonuclease domain-containing protein [Gaiellaceae bacterium]